jgi:HrpA-like RNA helicase
VRKIFVVTHALETFGDDQSINREENLLVFFPKEKLLSIDENHSLIIIVQGNTGSGRSIPIPQDILDGEQRGQWSISQSIGDQNKTEQTAMGMNPNARQSSPR